MYFKRIGESNDFRFLDYMSSDALENFLKSIVIGFSYCVIFLFILAAER